MRGIQERATGSITFQHPESWKKVTKSTQQYICVHKHTNKKCLSST